MSKLRYESNSLESDESIQDITSGNEDSSEIIQPPRRKSLGLLRKGSSAEYYSFDDTVKSDDETENSRDSSKILSSPEKIEWIEKKRIVANTDDSNDENEDSNNQNSEAEESDNKDEEESSKDESEEEESGEEASSEEEESDEEQSEEDDSQEVIDESKESIESPATKQSANSKRNRVRVIESDAEEEPEVINETDNSIKAVDSPPIKLTSKNPVKTILSDSNIENTQDDDVVEETKYTSIVTESPLIVTPKQMGKVASEKSKNQSIKKKSDKVVIVEEANRSSDIIESPYEKETTNSKPNVSDVNDTINESFNMFKSNRKSLKPTNNLDIIEISDTEEPTNMLSSTIFPGIANSATPTIKRIDDRAIASFSPNYERVKQIVKEKLITKETKEIKIIDVEDDMKKTDSDLMKNLKLQAPVMRGPNVQIYNKNIAFEDKLKVLSEQMIEVLQDKPDVDDFDSIEKVKNPKDIKVNLLSHQRYSMLWLKWREKNYPFGGILADDMGLGKTLTILSYLKLVKDEREEAALAKLREKGELDDEDGDKENDFDDEEFNSKDYLRKMKFKSKHSHRKLDVKPLKTLIILPASLLHQWQNEIKNKFKDNVFKYHVYHEANRKKHAYNLEDNDIVFTTYEIASRELDIFDKDGSERASDSPLVRVKWRRIILDEAHRIKNHNTKASKVICSLKAKYRIAITGTPVHNSLTDLYSLIKFLQFEPLNDISLWKYIFAAETFDSKKSNAAKATADARRTRLNSWLVILSNYVLLRRTKEDTIKGTNKRIVDLPNKSIEIVRCKLNSSEKFIYDKIFGESKEKVNDFLKNQQQRLLGRTTQNGSGALTEIFVYLLRLRQACCHLSLLSECLDRSELQNMKVESEGLENLMENLTINGGNESKQDVGVLDTITKSADLSKCIERSYMSSKLEKLLTMLDKIMDNNETDKVIVVSQWTSILSIVGHNLKHRRIGFCEINGNIPLLRRNEIVNSFNDESDSSIRVMLLSLTAGGVGLNLVGANHMFLLDIHWNPALEQQASDRIYRVGQRKDVVIHRFICENTIEERIEQIQQFKIEIAKKVCSAGAGVPGAAPTNTKLTLNDFRLLFQDFNEERK